MLRYIQHIYRQGVPTDGGKKVEKEISVPVCIADVNPNFHFLRMRLPSLFSIRSRSKAIEGIEAYSMQKV
jgi:hypothetical protein